MLLFVSDCLLFGLDFTGYGIVNILFLELITTIEIWMKKLSNMEERR
jgi:hypothetical protein